MEVLRYRSADGHVEIKITTNNIRMPWNRFKHRIGGGAAAYCSYRATREGTLYLTDMNSFDEQPRRIGEAPATRWDEQAPVMYETCPYGVNIRFSGIEGVPFVVHKMKEVTDLFSYSATDKGNGFLIGSLDFLNEPGDFALAYSYKPIDGVQRTDTLSFTVVSPKLDTKSDYLHIMETINREYNEMVFQYLTKTFQNLTREGRSKNDVVWLSIFRDIVNEYFKAVEFIINKPHLKTRHEVRYSKADRIKRWSPQMCERYAEKEREGALDNTLFRHEITETTLNTRENRFVKFTIERIAKRLSGIFRSILANNAKEVTDAEQEELKGYLKRLDKLERSSLFRHLKGESLRSESIVMQKRTGYAQVYRYWLMLQSGIELYEGNNAIGVRPVWELYELWCFLKMRAMVAEILDIDMAADADLFDEDKTSMFNPFTDNALEHTVHYINRTNGDRIDLLYQHTYNRNSGEVHTATTDNRPDIVLNIRKEDGFVLTYLFDAKYRVIDDEKFNREDATEQMRLGAADYPPSDAINQMHRYRDAIYYGENKYQHTAKEIIGGYILFPGRGNDDKVKERYYYKSIESVNIGAFPLLPSTDRPEEEGSLLRSHLKRILLEDTAYEQIKDSIPQKGLHYTDEKPKEKMVYVGTVLASNPMIEEFRKNRAEMYYTGGNDTPHSLDLQSIKYFMPIIGGKIQGVYSVVAVSAARKSDKSLYNDNPNDGVRFFLMLDKYIPFGDTAVACNNRLHNAEVLTLDGARETYRRFAEWG